MSYYYDYRPHYAFGPSLSKGVKTLIIIMVGIFFLQHFTRDLFITLFGLQPYLVWHSFFIWQVVTYIFLHGGLWHILFNLLALWMFGSELEYQWGTKFFIKYFFVTGIGAGVCTVLSTPNSLIPTIGCSGAIYGILLAFAMNYPDRIIYLNFLFPIKAKYFALIFGFIEFYSTLAARSDGIAHLAHLGGMVIGYIYLDHRKIIMKIKKWKNRNKFDSWNRWQ